MKMSGLYDKLGREFSAGTVLFREGDEGTEMYVIQSGKVKITRRVGAQEALLAILPEGEFLGEMSIINNQPRSATATVLEAAKLLVLDGRTFEAMIRGNAEIAVRMIKKLADRLHQADEQIELLLHRDPNHRVVQYLRQESSRLGIRCDAGIRIPITIRGLAERVGLSSDEVESVIKRLEKAKLVIRTSDGGFVLPEVGKLHEFLDFLEMKERFGSF
jgi:CRP-like cAMP-binding protein